MPSPPTSFSDPSSKPRSTASLVQETMRAHTTPLTQRTEAITSASRSLASQEKTLVQDTQKLSRQADALEKIVDRSVDQLKELGDLQNWAEVMFRDIAVVEETLRMTEELESPQAGGLDGRDGV